MSISIATAPKTIVVAGASGFVGRALPDVFHDDYRLIGLTRETPQIESDAEPHRHDGYEWRRCDLFSRKQCRDALKGADLAIYLVHSMRPSAALTQGHFRDMDLICADNFARAARHHDVEQIVYISGHLPDPDALKSHPLNAHLAARLEVEQTLASYGATVTTLRAGIVLGPDGDLSELLFRLVERMPVMWIPKWGQHQVSPIAREDLAELVRFVLENPKYAGQSWDVGGADTLTWGELLGRAGELLGRKRTFRTLPISMPALSTAWIAMVTGLPGAMVRPMIESLRQSGTPRDFQLQKAAAQTPIPLDHAMRQAIAKRPQKDGQNTRSETSKTSADDATGAELVRIDAPHEVRSVQRLPMPPGRDALWVATTYAEWLPRFMRPFVQVRLRDGRWLDFLLRPLPWPILSMELDIDVSKPDRQLYWIRGGLLAGEQNNKHSGGRLEFREVLDGKWALAAIHNFRPRLPWPLYMLTQAKIHLFVMHAFARYLGRLSSTPRKLTDEHPQLEDDQRTQKSG